MDGHGPGSVVSLEFLDRVLIKKRFYILDTLGGLTAKVFSKHGMHTECIQAVGVPAGLHYAVCCS